MPQSSAGLTAAELTAQNLDKSALLDDAIQRVGGNADELLAEFQLAFVMFLYGQSLEGDTGIPCRCPVYVLMFAVAQCVDSTPVSIAAPLWSMPSLP